MRIFNNACSILLIISIFVDAKHGEGESGGPGEHVSSSAPSPSPVVSPTPTPSSTPFQFDQPSNATTCQSTLLQWHASMPSVLLMTLAITNERGAQSSLTSVSSSTTPLVSRTLSTTVASNASQYTWSSVDVPEGWYVAAAFDTSQTAGISAQSPPFFVQTGSDVDCLSAAAPTSFDPATTSPSSGPTQSVAPATVTESAARKGLSPGALAATICAVFVGVAMLVLAFTYPQWWRHALRRHPRNRRPGGPYHLF